jgi:hypothetical protein
MRFFILLLLCACFSHTAMMTRGSYQDIQVGSSIAEVQTKVGEPYAIRKQTDGSDEYEYIERIPLGTEVVEENHYYLLVKNGQVMAKRMNQETPPAYDLIQDDDPNDIEQQ